jgi:hypothetical protein
MECPTRSLTLPVPICASRVLNANLDGSPNLPLSSFRAKALIAGRDARGPSKRRLVYFKRLPFNLLFAPYGAQRTGCPRSQYALRIPRSALHQEYPSCEFSTGLWPLTSNLCF